MAVNERAGRRGTELLKEGGGPLDVFAEHCWLDNGSGRTCTSLDATRHAWQEVQKDNTAERDRPAARLGREGALPKRRCGSVAHVQRHLLCVHASPEATLRGSQAPQATDEIFKNANIGDDSHCPRCKSQVRTALIRA